MNHRVKTSTTCSRSLSVPAYCLASSSNLLAASAIRASSAAPPRIDRFPSKRRGFVGNWRLACRSSQHARQPFPPHRRRQWRYPRAARPATSPVRAGRRPSAPGPARIPDCGKTPGRRRACWVLSTDPNERLTGTTHVKKVAGWGSYPFEQAKLFGRPGHPARQRSPQRVPRLHRKPITYASMTVRVPNSPSCYLCIAVYVVAVR